MEIVDEIVSTKRDSLNRPLIPVTLDVNIIEMSAGELRKLLVNR